MAAGRRGGEVTCLRSALIGGIDAGHGRTDPSALHLTGRGPAVAGSVCRVSALAVRASRLGRRPFLNAGRLSVGQGGDGWVAAEFGQAAVAAGPDAAGRKAEAGTDRDVWQRRVLGQQTISRWHGGGSAASASRSAAWRSPPAAAHRQAAPPGRRGCQICQPGMPPTTTVCT